MKVLNLCFLIILETYKNAHHMVPKKGYKTLNSNITLKNEKDAICRGFFHDYTWRTSFFAFFPCLGKWYFQRFFKGEDCTRANCRCSNKVKVKTISGILSSLYGWIYRLRNDNGLGLGDWSWLPGGSRCCYKVQHRGPHRAHRWSAVKPVTTIWWKLSWCSRNRTSQDFHLLEVKLRVNL